MRYFVGDCETTGLGAPPNVMACEIALVEIDEDLNIIHEWETLIDPGIPIAPVASKIHGITDAMVTGNGTPTMQQALDFIFGAAITEPIALVCHNIKFDRRFFGPYLNIKHELCTLELARRYMPMAPNHRLGTLRQHCGLKAQPEHEAMGDIMIVVDLLRHILPLTQRTFLQLLGTAAKPVMLYTMPFGEHKGKPFQEISVDYRNWLLQQDISPDLRYTRNSSEGFYMRFHDYLPQAIRTVSPMGHDEQVMHAQFGMLSEVGELADMVKKNHAYGKPLDRVNGMEEVGDICWYIALYCHEQGVDGVEVDVMLERHVEVRPLKESIIMAGGLVGALCIDEKDRGSIDREVLQLLMPLLSCIVEHFGFTLGHALARNIEKLNARYKSAGFDPHNAVNRDLDAERDILEQSIKAHPDTNN